MKTPSLPHPACRAVASAKAGHPVKNSEAVQSISVRVLNAVSAVCLVSPTDLQYSRLAEHVWARNLACWVLNNRFRIPKAQIAPIFNLARSTVDHAIQTATNRFVTEPHTAADLEAVNAQMDTPFSRAEIIAGIVGLYSEWRELKCKQEGLSNIRLPDFEDMLTHIDKYGIAPLSQLSTFNLMSRDCGDQPSTR